MAEGFGQVRKKGPCTARVPVTTVPKPEIVQSRSIDAGGGLGRGGFAVIHVAGGADDVPVCTSPRSRDDLRRGGCTAIPFAAVLQRLLQGLEPALSLGDAVCAVGFLEVPELGHLRLQ